MAPLHNLPLRAMASAVWWALSTLLTTREFWAGLAATLIGVLLAFELERWRDRRHSREQYAWALNAVRYETAQLHGICLQALAALPRGLSSYEIDAPALRGFVSSPALQEHGSHGLTIVLIGLLSSVGAARNSLEHFRRQVRIGGTEILAVHLAPLSKHLTNLKAGIESAQTLLDRELRRLKHGVRESEQDRRDIQAFRDATED